MIHELAVAIVADSVKFGKDVVVVVVRTGAVE